MINPFAYQTAQYRTIVVGTALGGGYPAVRRALNLADHTDGSVTVVHAVEQEGTRAADGSTRAPLAVGEAQAVLARLRKAHPRIAAVRVSAERSWVVLAEVAREVGAQLVVIGSHVHHRLAALLGATSDRILQRVPGDVLAVRSQSYSASQPPADFRRIVLATDLGPDSDAAARRAAALAGAYGAELTLLNVVERYPTDRENDEIAREDEDPLEHQQRVREAKLRELAVRAGCADAAVEVVSTTEPAGHAVSEFARQRAADLVVIGSPAEGAWRTLLGSAGQAVVHRVPCDVLVVRGQEGC